MNVTALFDVSDIPMPDKWPTAYMAAVPRITGILSVISSSIIIYLVYRSAARTSTIYHRIMVGMSIADILFSTAVSLTSLPMPKQLPFEDELRSSSSLLDNWDPGPRYGNTYTCNAQGFIGVAGAFVIFLYNVSLCVYYGCSIGLQMREDKIRKYIQPFLLGAPILFGLIVAIPLVIFEMINPPTSPWQAPWCVGFAYPYGCSDDEEAENTCIRGSMASTEIALIYNQLMVRISIFIVVLSLALVIWRVVYTNRKMRTASRYKEKRQGDSIEAERQKRKTVYLYNDEDNVTVEQHTLFSATSKKKAIRATVNTRVILIQCLAYIVAWFLGVAWDFIPLGMTRVKVGLLFFPLQGFFNMIIFVSHKVYNYRRLHPEEGVCEVLETMFTGRIQEPCFISRISFVMDDGNVSVLDKFQRNPEEGSGRLRRKGLQLTPKKNCIYAFPEEDNRKDLQDGKHVDASKIIIDKGSVQDDDSKDISMPSSNFEINVSPCKKSREERRRERRRNIEDSSRIAFDSEDDDDRKKTIEEGSWDKDIADIADLSEFSSMNRSKGNSSSGEKKSFNLHSSASSFFSKFSGLSLDRS